MRDGKYYEYDIDVGAVAEVWRRGSVISSWLVDLTAEALAMSPELAEYSGHVSDSGEGRWTAQAAIDLAVPAPVINASLTSRFASRNQDEFASKVLSAMRAGFRWPPREEGSAKDERSAPRPLARQQHEFANEQTVRTP